jgi:hypothetical protein
VVAYVEALCEAEARERFEHMDCIMEPTGTRDASVTKVTKVDEEG